jgi:ubiquinone/menaquinone biosynthesis C-methylase UbiE
MVCIPLGQHRTTEMMMINTLDDARFWDRNARKYARASIKDMAGYDRTLERTRALLKRSDTVLEIGCGTGTTAIKLAPSVGWITATDVSREMVMIAREKADAEICGNATFEVARGPAAVSGGIGYNAVLAFNLLHLVADRAALLAAILGGLKPGGLFISKTPCLSEMNPLIRMAIPVMQAIGIAPFVATFSAIELEHELVAAGFTVIERERHGSRAKDARIFLVARKPDARPRIPAGI